MKASPHPRTGEIHLHCLPLPHDVPELARFKKLLSIPEKERAFLLKSDLAKNRYIAGRGVLRDILGGYLDRDPAVLQIATGEHGKPYLAGGEANLRFNLSHVDGVLILAVADGVEIGIDIERIDTDKPVHTMARLAFSQREQEELFTLPLSQQSQAFYHCWVRKEACLKACGRGFSVPGNSFNIPVCLEKLPLQALINCDTSLWHVRDIDVPAQYCAAVAVEADGISPSPPTIVWVVKKTYRYGKETSN